VFGQRWLLLLTDRYAEVYRVHKQHLYLLKQFDQDDEGIKAFSAWLPSSPLKPHSVPLRILVDLREEEYQISNIPHVSAFDRRHLFQHRLRRLYNQATYTYACVQGKLDPVVDDQTGISRKDDCALFTALNHQGMPRQWVKPLLAQEISIQGIHSVPLLAAKVLKGVDLPEYSLFVTPTNTAVYNASQLSIRQFFFKKGRLIFSRLLPLPDNISTAQFIHDELQKTTQYLQGIRMLAENQHITVIFSAQLAFLEHLHKQSKPLTEDKNKSYQWLPLQQLPISKKIKNFQNKQQDNLYFNHLVLFYSATHRLDNHYAQQGEKRDYHYYLLRRFLHISSTLIFLAAGGVAAYYYYQAYLIDQDVSQVKQEEANMQVSFRAAQERQKQLLGISVDVIHIKNAVDSIARTQKKQIAPDEALTILSHVLNDYPQIHLKRLAWKIDVIRPKMQQNSGNISSFQRKVLAGRKNNEPKDKYRIKLNLKGQLNQYDGNRTRALKTVKHFVKALGTHARIDQVNINQLPLNVDPNKSFSGSVITNNQAQKEETKFEIEVLLKPLEAIKPVKSAVTIAPKTAEQGIPSP